MSGRNCCRCRKELTDAASMEAGIGPICRNLDNALLARLIPSNMDKAREVLGSLDLTSVAPETLPTMIEVSADIGGEEREDWRKTVKRIEWALSFDSNSDFRPLLTEVVAALGYIGLAALWNGEAATGKAVVLFLTDRFVVTGPRKKAANTTFKAIYGRRFHPANAFAGVDKPSWSFPAKALDEVFRAVATHYPNHTGLIEAVEAANALVKANTFTDAEAPKVEVAPAKKCSIENAGVLLKIRTPYNPDFITELKSTVKWSDRRWNKGEKVWEVTANHETEMKNMVAKHYGEEAL